MEPAPAASSLLRAVTCCLLPLFGAVVIAFMAQAGLARHGASGVSIAPAYAAGDCDPAAPMVMKGLPAPGECTPPVAAGPLVINAPASTPAVMQVAPGPTTVPLAPSGPVVIDGRTDVVLKDLHVTSTSGPCIIVRNSQRVSILDSEIGPCGGKGIELNRSSAIRVSDSYIHPEFAASGCCDTADGIHAILSSQVVIQGNVIAYAETNVELQGVTQSEVMGNYLVNPQGPYPRGGQVQVWSYGTTRSSDVSVHYNYAMSTKDPSFLYPESQWDAISIGQSDRVTVGNNYVIGGRSHSGCGIAADDGANSVQFLSNTIIDTGQCGIGIGSGTNQVVDGNRIYGIGLNLPDAGNTALYVWNQYAVPCGPVSISNNIAVLTRPDGKLSSYWDGGGCGNVSLSNNTWDTAAISQLSPVEVKFPPPPTPPMPYMMLNQVTSGAVASLRKPTAQLVAKGAP